MPGEQIQSIVVPIDGSSYSFDAASYAIRLAKKFNADIVFLHVLSINKDIRFAGVYGTYALEAIAKATEQEKKQAAQWISKIEAEAKGQGVTFSSEVIDGPQSVAGEIVTYAENHKPDLIVIGSRGQTGFKRLILGSVASSVVTYAPCNVLVVKSTKS